MQLINHIFSSDLHSQIFDDFFNYFVKYGVKFNYISSNEPIYGASLFHYHRTFLEKHILNPSITTVHHDLNDYTPDQNDVFQTYKQLDKIICLNNNQKKILEKKKIKNVHLIPHGYNKHIVSCQKKINCNEKISIGFFSKRYARKVKGENYFLELATYLDKEKFKFILFGDSRFLEKKYLDELGYEVELFEFLPYKVFISLYSKIHFLLITSIYEGGPASVPEAVKSSTPILGTAVGMVNDFLRDEYNGFFLTGNLIEDLNKINRLKNIDFSNNLLKNSYQLSIDSKKIFSWKQVIFNYEEVYENIIKGVKF